MNIDESRVREFYLQSTKNRVKNSLNINLAYFNTHI